MSDRELLRECRTYISEFAAAGNKHAPKLLKRIDAALATPDGWVAVSERLPEPGEQVIARRCNGTWDRAECNPIYFDGLPAWYLPEGPTMSGPDGVTHWALPPSPEGGDK